MNEKAYNSFGKTSGECQGDFGVYLQQGKAPLHSLRKSSRGRRRLVLLVGASEASRAEGRQPSMKKEPDFLPLSSFRPDVTSCFRNADMRPSFAIPAHAHSPASTYRPAIYPTIHRSSLGSLPLYRLVAM
jgi:hypothetical protein